MQTQINAEASSSVIDELQAHPGLRAATGSRLNTSPDRKKNQQSNCGYNGSHQASLQLIAESRLFSNQLLMLLAQSLITTQCRSILTRNLCNSPTDTVACDAGSKLNMRCESARSCREAFSFARQRAASIRTASSTNKSQKSNTTVLAAVGSCDYLLQLSNSHFCQAVLFERSLELCKWSAGFHASKPTRILP